MEERDVMDAATYLVTERLRDGTMLQLRSLRPGDRAEMLASVERFSSETRYRRFFAPKRHFSEREIDFLLNVDFVGHVALVALVSGTGCPDIVGGGRYVVGPADSAEIAFAVADSHQKLGIATHLIHHLVTIARAAGLARFVADVLPENAPMLRVFERSGLTMTTRKGQGIVHVMLSLPQAGGID